MSEAPPFVMLTILMLVTVLLIFAMKYAAQAMRARSNAAQAAQASAELIAIRDELKAMDGRLTRIESLLREVE